MYGAFVYGELADYREICSKNLAEEWDKTEFECFRVEWADFSSDIFWETWDKKQKRQSLCL